MQKVLGLLMLGGGLAYLVNENAPSPTEREEQLAAITRIVARAKIIEPETVPAEHPGLRRPVTSTSVAYQAPPVSAPALPTPPRAAVDAEPSPDLDALPTVSVRNEVPTQQTVAPTTEKSPNIQRQLARQIQVELKRVGCYSGRLDGSWGDRSRNAMANFITRVNASLPTSEPDVFLLSLIKGQTKTVCGPSCGTGEVLSAGRCVARSVVAENAPEPAPAREDTEQGAVLAARIDPLPGRMSIGGPVPAAATTPEPVTAWTAPATERLPWQAEPQNAPTQDVAALETEDARSGDDFASSTAPRKTMKAKKWGSAAPKPVKRRYSASRSVQQIFMHPLGRM
jgi:hypothetical protein